MAQTAKTVATSRQDKDAANRKEIVRTIKGPVTERLAKIIPGLSSYDDPYNTVIRNPELLYGCLQVFAKERQLFADLLVDAAGQPVTDDDAPLKCERSINQVVGMVVRSGCKAYAESRWEKSADANAVMKAETRTLLDRIANLVRGKWSESEQPKPSPTQADKFYAAINDHLNYDWQVPLIPLFAELPVKLLLELGPGCTTLRNPDAIAQLADIGRHNMEQARRILSDDMMREMLDTQPLAAKGIAFLGKERYEFLHGAVYEKMGENFWEMCTDCNRLEIMEQKNAKDLEQIADFLHLVSAETIDQVIRLLQFQYMPVFLRIGLEKLGENKFREIFDSPANKKLIKIFCEKAASYKLDPGDPLTDFESRLPDLFGAYLRAPAAFEKGL